MTQNIGRELSASAENKLVQLHAMFRYSVENVQAWAVHDVMREVLIDDSDRRIQKMLLANQKAHGLFNGLFVANSAGKIIASSDEEILGKNVQGLPWFQKTMASGESQIGSLRYEMLFGGYGISITQPIFSQDDEPKVIGVLSGSFSWRKLLAQVDQVQVAGIESENNRNGVYFSGSKSSGSFGLFLDTEGYVIAAPNFVLNDPEFDNLKQEADRYRVTDINIRTTSLYKSVKDKAGDSTYYESRFGGVDYVVGYASTPSHLREIAGVGWTALVFHESSKAFAPLDKLQNMVLGIGILSLVLIACGSVFVANSLSSPIMRISDWAKIIAAGKFDEPILVETNDEIGVLATSVHQLRLRIEAYIDRMKIQNQETEEKNRLLQTQKVAIEKKNQSIEVHASELEAAERYKARFLANMSLKLQPPLHSTLELSKTLSLALTDKLDDENAKALTTIQANTKRLSDLIGNILDVAELDAGKLVLDLSDLDLAELCEDALQKVSALSQEKDLQVQFHNHCKKAVVSGDYGRLLQVLLNILDNAIKFTDAGRIIITLEKLPIDEVEGSRVAIKVKDTGCGIASEELPALLRNAGKESANNVTSPSHAGLGVLIVEEIISLHEGVVDINSEPGQGTEVIVLLPLKSDA